ncbi:hypothetical protein LOTGIDRAFT_100069, partial [Lottia gigantea]
TTSKKHNYFIAEPMGQKPITAIPGLGQILGQRLADAGYHYVRNIPVTYSIFK